MVASPFKYLNIVQFLVLLEPTSRWKTRELITWKYNPTGKKQTAVCHYVLNLLWINPSTWRLSAFIVPWAS